MEHNVKKVFLITAEQRKPYHLRNLKTRYKSQIVFTDNLLEAEHVICIEREHFSTSEKEKLLHAQELGIRISYFTEELLPEREIKQELNQLEKIPQKMISDEITFSGEEL